MNRKLPELELWKSAGEIRKQVRQMAKLLNREYRKEELQIMGVLRGGALFMTDLLRCLTIPMSIQFINLYYKEGHIGDNQVKEIEEAVIYPAGDVTGKTVLLLGDVVDTGIVINHLRNLIMARGAKDVRIAAIIDKFNMRRTDIKVDYALFEDKDRDFIVGYGLDYQDKYYHLPYLALLKI